MIESIHEWAVEWVENGARSLAARLIAGRLVPEVYDVEVWRVCRAELAFFSFDAADRKHQGQ